MGVLVTPCLIDGLLEGKESFILPVDRGRGCRVVVHKTEETRGGGLILGIYLQLHVLVSSLFESEECYLSRVERGGLT